jgi:hypothetical protein
MHNNNMRITAHGFISDLRSMMGFDQQKALVIISFMEHVFHGMEMILSVRLVRFDAWHPTKKLVTRRECKKTSDH